MSAFETAYYDLLGMLALLNTKKNKKFQAVIVYPLIRDICLMLYQINKELLGNSVELDPAIKKIRNRVKLYQKKNNEKIYHRIVEYHIKQFGNDIDNLGFYLDGEKLKGSTIYTTYIFQDTDFFMSNPIDTNKGIYNFSKIVGNTTVVILEELKEKIGYDMPAYGSLQLVNPNVSEYNNKDVLNENFFSKESKKNIFLIRLLTSLQEATASIWLYDKLSDEKTLDLHHYISIRLISIKVDEVMDNLINLKEFSSESFNELNQASQGSLNLLLINYNEEVASECRVLRNMIHYNIEEDNFLQYLEEKIKRDENYIKNLMQIMIQNYMEPLSDLISSYLKVHELESMNDWQKILERLKSILKRKDFKKSKYY